MQREYYYCPRCAKKLVLKTIEKTKKRYACKECGWIHYNNPTPVAIALCRNKKGEILVVRRGIKPGYNQWALPGGFVDQDEAPEHACLRELKEETGIRGRIKRLLGVHLRMTTMYGALTVIGYEVEALSKKINKDEEIKEAHFFKIDELPNITFPVHKKFIKTVISNIS